MNTVVIVCVIGVLCFSVITVAQRTDDEQFLKDTEQQLARAWSQHDRAFIEGVLAPEWAVTQADGTMLTRSVVLGTFFDAVQFDSNVIDDVTVALFGDTAVVRGRTTASAKLNGAPVHARIRFTDVFIRRNGRWQVVASHASRSGRGGNRSVSRVAVSNTGRGALERLATTEGRWSVRTSLLSSAIAALLFTSAAAGQQPVAGKVGVASVLQRSYAASKADLTGEAEKMPEGDYSLKPGGMPDVRTFGQLFGHVAAGQFGMCAAVKGVPSPMAGKTLEDFKTKAEVVTVLADSFAFCDDAFSSTTDENAMQFVKQGPNELPRAAVLFGLLAHNSEMYGVGTVYLRLRGIVPPSTERANARRRGGR